MSTQGTASAGSQVRHGGQWEGRCRASSHLGLSRPRCKDLDRSFHLEASGSALREGAGPDGPSCSPRVLSFYIGTQILGTGGDNERDHDQDANDINTNK